MSRRARPSIVALNTSQKVQKLIPVWQNINDFDDSENDTPAALDNIVISSPSTPKKKLYLQSQPSKTLKTSKTPKTPETPETFNSPTPEYNVRSALTEVTNSPKSPSRFSNSSKVIRKRKRNENILDFIEERMNSPSRTKSPLRQTIACTDSPSTSPVKRQKLSKSKEKKILSPLRKTKSRRQSVIPTTEDSEISVLSAEYQSPKAFAMTKSPIKSPKVLVDELKERNRLQKLREALKEVYSTEQTYWKNLLQMQSVFYFGAQGILSPSELKVVFSNSSAILLHSQKLLLSLREIELKIEQQEELEPERDHVLFHNAAAQIVHQMTEILPSSLDDYKEYCQNYEDAHVALLACDTRDSKFHQFLSTTQRKQVLNLYDSLILPVQRLPRYQMLLQAIQKYFKVSPYPEDESIVDLLEDGVQLIINMNTSIDKALKAHGNIKQMKKIASLFLPEYCDFFNPSQREFIKKGNLKGHINFHYRRQKSIEKHRDLFMQPVHLTDFILVIFNDQIVVAAMDNKLGKLNIQHYLGFDSSFLIDSSASMGKHAFQLVNPNYGFTFFPKNKSELISYKATFKNTLKAQTDKNPAILILRKKIILEEDHDSHQWCAKHKMNKYCSLRRQKKARDSLTLSDTLPPERAETKSLRGNGKISKSTNGMKSFSPLRLLSPRRKKNNKQQTNWKTFNPSRDEFPMVEDPIRPATSCSSKHIEGQRQKMDKMDKKRKNFSRSNPNLPRDDIIRAVDAIVD